jgi:hypothetical protein
MNQTSINSPIGASERSGEPQEHADVNLGKKFRRSAGRKSRRAVAGAVGVLAVLGASFISAAAAQAADTQSSHFVQTATSSNISGDTTFINNGATNGNPNAVLFVTPNWDTGDVCGCVYDSVPVGVWYDYSNSRWGIFQENGSTMPSGAAFNVLVMPRTSANVFVQTATSSNSLGDTTYINNSATNGAPGAILQATQVWNPGGTGDVYNDHPIGVWYDGSGWAVFQEDSTTMTSGASFNILVGSTGTGGGKASTSKATSSNRSGDTAWVNSSVTNGDSNAFVLDTPNWNPKGVGGTYDPYVTGVWYGGSKIGVFNETGATMAVNEAFNLVSYNS